MPVFGSADHLSNIVGHAGVGCLSSVASGGSCGSGAASAAVGAGMTPLANTGSLLGDTAVVAVSGGLASVAGGGKFSNGAETAAFGYLFNAMASCARSGAGCSGLSEAGKRRCTFGLSDMKKLLLLAILVAAIAAVAAPRLVEFFREDSCLDSGGRWNAGNKDCEH